MKELIKDKFNLRYFIPLILFLLVLVLFLSSGAIKKATTPTITTPINRTLNVSTGSDKIQFKSATYYEKSNLLVTAYYLISDDVVPDNSLKITSYDGKTSDKIEAQVERVNANYYVVFTPSIANNFKQIVNDIDVKSNNSDEENIGAVAITQNNIKRVNKAYAVQSVSAFDKEYAVYAIENIHSKQKNIDKQIKKLDKNINQITQQNKELLDELDFKTDEQQAEIQQNIDANNSQIEGIKSQINDLKTQKGKLSEQEKLLSQTS